MSRKVGCAVVRNRIKRLIREFVRLHSWVPNGVDVVIVAKRRSAGLAGYADVVAELQGVVLRPNKGVSHG